MPGTLYTWPGTGDVAEWVAETQTNTVTVANSTAGLLTATETGLFDPINEIFIVGGASTLHDGFNRRYEGSTEQGGLDLTGLNTIELDVQHNGTANVNVQFYMQTTPSYTYLWGGSDPANTLGGADWSVAPNTPTTLKFPIHALTPAQQAWISAFGLSIRAHEAAGNVTWNISDVRTVGTALTVRNLATHDVGSSDNGFQGAICNFDCGAVVGGDGGQNQTGLSQNTSGSGSLQWTDLGGGPGAAISWGNGTAWNGNTFYERLVSAPQYDFLIYRISATGTGPAPIGVQGWFQTGNYNFQVAGGSGFSYPLAVDGQYHDIAFPIANVTNRENIQQFGINLFSHPNDAVMNIDNVQFLDFQGLPGDYNNDGKVDAADYVVLRKNLNTATTLPNDVTPGNVTIEDGVIWRYFFGTTGSGSGLDGGGVPEPSTMAALLLALLGWAASRPVRVKTGR
jgi:hypothetical protein